jgi:hypothetical protein
LFFFFFSGFLQKYLRGVFELPLPRNAQKRTKTTSQEKKVGWWVGGSGLKQMYGGGRRFFLGGPSILDSRPVPRLVINYKPASEDLALPLLPASVTAERSS